MFDGMTDAELVDILSSEQGHAVIHKLETASRQRVAMEQTTPTTRGSTSGRHQRVRALLARESQGGSLANVSDEELDEMLNSERGQDLILQLENASRQRMELEALREEAGAANDEMVDVVAGRMDRGVTGGTTGGTGFTGGSTKALRAKQRQMVKMLLSTGDDNSKFMDELTDVQLDAIIDSERGQDLLKQLEDASAQRAELNQQRQALEATEAAVGVGDGGGSGGGST